MKAKEFVSEKRKTVDEEPDSNFGNQVANVVGNVIKSSPIGSAIDVVDNIRKGDVGGAVGSAVNLAGKTVGYAMGGLPGLAVGTALDTAGDAIKKYTAPATTPPPKQKKIQEASGYIPKNKQEANDPRWQMAMTQDIKPGEDKRQAERMGWHLDSNGRPPKLSTSGKTNEAVIDVAVQAREPLSPGSFGLMRSRADYGTVIHHPKRIYKAAVEALTARLQQKAKVEQEISNIAHQFKMKEGNLVRAFEMIKHIDPHDYHKKAIDKIKKSPLKI